MTDDRELLELAAKAAGGQARFDLSPDEAPWLQGVVDGRPQPYPVRWNPLADDGDALRLAVKLQLSMDLFDDAIAVGYTPNDNECEQVSEPVWSDPYAATRRAIVRAAAEIGKSLSDVSIGRSIK
jgi:hypothetical protein